MEKSKKLLNFFLGFNAVIQLLLGCWVLFGLNSLLAVEKMTYTNDLKVFSTFFGLCLLIFSTLGFMTMSFNKNNKPEAVFLSKFIGISLIIGGCIVIAEIQRVDLAAVDMVRGILITIFAFRAGKQ
jgi:hypothetical protein